MGACAVMMVFVSVNQVLVRLWARVPGTGSGAIGVCHDDTADARSARAVARRSMACLTGKCVRVGVPCGMAAPVIGGEGSEALCDRLIGSAGAVSAQAVAVRQVREDRVMCEVTIPQDHPHGAAAPSETARGFGPV
jgi:hypothetical protein